MREVAVAIARGGSSQGGPGLGGQGLAGKGAQGGTGIDLQITPNTADSLYGHFSFCFISNITANPQQTHFLLLRFCNINITYISDLISDFRGLEAIVLRSICCVSVKSMLIYTNMWVNYIDFLAPIPYLFKLFHFSI